LKSHRLAYNLFRSAVEVTAFCKNTLRLLMLMIRLNIPKCENRVVRKSITEILQLFLWNMVVFKSFFTKQPFVTFSIFFWARIFSNI